MAQHNRLHPGDPPAAEAISAIRGSDLPKLQQLLAANSRLATAHIGAARGEGGEGGDGTWRTLLHVVADAPGHIAGGPDLVAALVRAGADPNARCHGTHGETALHWAASSDDVPVLDALLDAGAEIDAPGAVIAGGTALDDAVAFGQWRAAARLVERGARAAVWHCAALGMIERVAAHFTGEPTPPAAHPWGADSQRPPDECTVAFWCACHGGQRRTAEYVLDRADEHGAGRAATLDWVAVWDRHTPLDAAQRSGAGDVVQWLRGIGAKPA